jgi:hypothetical protein
VGTTVETAMIVAIAAAGMMIGIAGVAVLDTAPLEMLFHPP